MFALQFQVYVDPQDTSESSDYGVGCLHFWRHNCSNFPTLGVFARECLSKPPSQVSVERLFSIAGFIASKRRLSMKPETIEKLVFIYMNGRKLGLKY